MGDVSGGNSSMKNHSLVQQDWDSNNGDVNSGNGYIYIYTISQCNDSSSFKEMNGDVSNGDVSSGYGYMNRHTVYKNNGLKYLSIIMIGIILI